MSRKHPNQSQPCFVIYVESSLNNGTLCTETASVAEIRQDVCEGHARVAEAGQLPASA